jgi:hypothetical protein
VKRDFEGDVRDIVQQFLVGGDQTATLQLERALPVIPGGSWSGPVATSARSCMVIVNWTPSHQREVMAYEYRLDSGQIARVGRLSLARPEDLALALFSSSPLSGELLVAGTYAESPHPDPPWTWVPGTDQWRELDQAYPASRGLIPKRCITAAYSPDGSLLAVAAQRGCDQCDVFSVFTYDLKTHKVDRFAGPLQGVCVRLALSPDNSELLWEDLGGFGLISRHSAERKYWSDGRLKGLPKNSYARRGAFARDGKHLYFVVRFGMDSTWLASFDPSSGAWRVIRKNEPGSDEFYGFAVMPAASSSPGAGPE